MKLIIEALSEWNETAITETCLSNPELHAMSDAFGTKDQVEMIMMLADIATDERLFTEVYNTYIERRTQYINEKYEAAQDVFYNELKNNAGSKSHDQVIKDAIKLSAKYVMYNEKTIHDKKECHCYC